MFIRVQDAEDDVDLHARQAQLVSTEHDASQLPDGHDGLCRHALTAAQQDQVRSQLLHVRLNQGVVQGVNAKLLEQLHDVIVWNLPVFILLAHLHQHLHLLHREPLALLDQGPAELVPRQRALAAGVEAREGLSRSPGHLLNLLTVAELNGLGLDGRVARLALLTQVILPAALQQGLDELRRCLHKGAVLDPSRLKLGGRGEQQLDVPVSQAQRRRVKEICHLLVGELELTLLVSSVEDVL
mmetsp:Transcript_4964/g.12793  ORF Transcript_4964/g.12793 Transcript_4964/m.12793 type:complete len:241 (-) Transcript_4964:714-1436(-)